MIQPMRETRLRLLTLTGIFAALICLLRPISATSLLVQMAAISIWRYVHLCGRVPPASALCSSCRRHWRRPGGPIDGSYVGTGNDHHQNAHYPALYVKGPNASLPPQQDCPFSFLDHFHHRLLSGRRAHFWQQNRTFDLHHRERPSIWRQPPILWVHSQPS